MAILEGQVLSNGQFYPYEIDGSLRFNDDDSAYLSWTPASAGDRKTWTFSAWVKRGNLGTTQHILSVQQNAVADDQVFFSSDQLIISVNDGITLRTLSSTPVFRDPSSWYHIVLSFDTTQATDTNRVNLYVNGKIQDITGTYPPQNYDCTGINTAQRHGLACRESGPSSFFDGYLAEVHFTDGTAYGPEQWGELKNGVWIPKSPSVTYGTNGFYLPLSADALDDSGNGNSWTAVNLASSDYVLDSPTLNFATLNPLNVNGTSNVTLSEGNLKSVCSLTNNDLAYSNIYQSSGKYYIEATFSSIAAGATLIGGWNAVTNQTAVIVLSTGALSNLTATGASPSSYSVGDIVGILLNLDDYEITFYKNGTINGSANTITIGSVGDEFAFVLGNNQHTAYVNFGQDSSFAGNKTAQGNTDANGIGDFYYTPPSGYLALCSSNLPEPTIGPNSDTQADQHFNTVLWTGDGSTQSITGVGFQPDFTWIKKRPSPTRDHTLFDSVRGAGEWLASNLTDAESTQPAMFASFDSDGFTVGSNSYTNESGSSHVAWNWLADNTSGSSNTDGTITSTVAANTDAGFSIVSCVAPASGDFTVGHGLTKTPDLIIAKDRETAGTNWHVWFGEWTNVRDYMLLNTTAAKTTQPTTNVWGSSVPNSSVFGMTADSIMVGSAQTIAYCFHSVEGYSKFGSYTGNGDADGPFVYTGFRPAFVMIKASSVVDSWYISDSARTENNVIEAQLRPNLADAEANNMSVDFLSNGFKMRSAQSSGATFIYMAFAENPFKYSNAR